MRLRSSRLRTTSLVTAGAALALLWVIVSIGSAPDASAQLRAPLPSDARATFVLGNATTCAAVGFASDVQMGSGSNTSASDANVSGTVATNAGTTQPGTGQEVNVTI